MKHKLKIIVPVFFGCLLYGVYWICPFPGCYGPFEIVVKSENGERVEDIIVSISQFETGIWGLITPDYGATVIGNTGEILRFPRGYIYINDSPEVSLYFGVNHPDYSLYNLYTRGTKGFGTIELESRTIYNRQDMRDQDNAEKILQWKAGGLGEEEIELKLKGKRTIDPRSNLPPSYFARLLDLGRKDLFEKHWEIRTREVINSRGWDADEAKAWKQKKMKLIDAARR